MHLHGISELQNILAKELVLNGLVDSNVNHSYIRAQTGH